MQNSLGLIVFVGMMTHSVSLYAKDVTPTKQITDVAMAAEDQRQNVISRLFHIPKPKQSQCVKLVRQSSQSPQSLEPLEGVKGRPAQKTVRNVRLARTSEQSMFETSYDYVGEGFGGFLYQIKRALEARNTSQLAQFMHPRLHTTSAQISKAIGSLNIEPDSPVSLHELWAVYSHDHSSDDVECRPHGMILSPLYGYELQFMVWFSLAGRQDMARVFMGVVPVNGQLYVGVLRSQMWTHNSHTPTQWVAQADQELARGDVMSAYVKYKIAQMLIDGGSYYKLALETKIEEYLKRRNATQTWFSQVNELIVPQSSERLVKASPLLTQGGAGIYFKFGLQEEWSSKQINDHCQSLLKNLQKHQVMKHLNGIRCGYHLPLETDYTKDGVMGSLYLSSES